MHIQNILWEIDGTLFDTYPAMTYAISKSLTAMGHSLELNVIDGLVRQSLDHCLDTLSQRFKLDRGPLYRHFVEYYREIPPANQPPFPKVKEVCGFINQHGGLNLIATHRGLDSAHRLLNTYALESYFADILSQEQGYPRKPNPAMVVAMLTIHALNYDDTLLMGANEVDNQAGRAAKVRTCIFRRALLSQPANYQINDYNELLAILKREEYV
jgi:phosphoglycolate phosphatase-like HAD superfamily hydrolase